LYDFEVPKGDAMQKIIPVESHSTHCKTCLVSQVCLPVGMAESEVGQLDKLVTERIRVEKGQALYRHGDALHALFGLRSGSIKTLLEEADGAQQITGFFLPGEVIGMDGLIEGEHGSSAIAMEDSEACVVRIKDIDEISRYVPSLQHQVRRLMSKEIARSYRLHLTLGSMRSEQRLAIFLSNLSQRLAALGYSPTEFVMRMSREEIGNYLGLTLETISRLFSRFARDGIIKINQRDVKILDKHALTELGATHG
jgi:CRP/FNR family transcriptional regulator